MAIKSGARYRIRLTGTDHPYEYAPALRGGIFYKGRFARLKFTFLERSLPKELP